MCFPKPCAPGCICPTRPCTSLFGMTNRWWPYSDLYLGTYGIYPAGGFHLPWYFLMGPTDLYPAATVDPLPRHCLGTDTFTNGSLHVSFLAMWLSLVPIWQAISRSMYHARAASDEIVFLKWLQILSSTTKNTCARQSAPTFSSCSLMFSNPYCTASTPCFCGSFIPNNVSGTRNKSTALDLRCCTTLEVGVVFFKIFRISGVIWLIHCFYSSASSIYQISCTVQRMKSMIKTPCSVFSMFAIGL